MTFPRVVHEYAYIFLDELSGLPPHREIEFAIESLPDTSPILLPCGSCGVSIDADPKS